MVWGLGRVSQSPEAGSTGRAQKGLGGGVQGGGLPRPQLQPPYPILRTARASAGPVFKGVCKQFSRSQGHGFITPENGSEDIFVHVSE